MFFSNVKGRGILGFLQDFFRVMRGELNMVSKGRGAGSRPLDKVC